MPEHDIIMSHVTFIKISIRVFEAVQKDCQINSSVIYFDIAGAT